MKFHLFILLAIQVFLQRSELASPCTPKKIELILTFPYLDVAGRTEPGDPLYARLLIKNNTDSVASFYDDWNSNGYFNVAFQVRTTKGVDTLFQKPRNWPKNYPSYQVLFPGDSMVLFYNLRETKLQSSPFEGFLPAPSQGLLGIKAIYQLDAGVHATADVLGTIKYRYQQEDDSLVFRTEPGSRYRKNKPMIIDSLPEPIKAKRNFPLVKLESNEYRF